MLCRRLVLVLMFGFILSSSFVVEASDLKGDFQVFKSWFAGRFDNYFQVWKERGLKVPKRLRHHHIHSIFAPIALPQLGRDFYYVQQSSGRNYKRIYRQRLYQFKLDKKKRRIVLYIYSLLKPKRYVGGHLKPNLWKVLKKSDVRLISGCEVNWRREGKRFVGETVPGKCRIRSRRTGKMLLIEDLLYLTRDGIWIRDRATDEKGRLVFGHPGNVHHKLRRVNGFSGWVVIKKKNAKGYVMLRGLKLHDQGQKLKLVDRAGKPLGYSVQLAQLVYQKRKIAVLKLALYKDGKKRSIAYTWSDPSSRRIGLNLRWLQVGFTRDKPAAKR